MATATAARSLRERPVQRASDFATDDGNVVVTHEQFTEWDQRYPAVSNKRGRVRHAGRSWLSEERDQSQFEARFEAYLKYEQRKAAARKPKQTPEQKQEAEQVALDEEKRRELARFVRNNSNERHRLRRELEERQAAPEEIDRVLREHSVMACIQRVRRGYGLPSDGSIVEEAKRRALEEAAQDPFAEAETKRVHAMFDREEAGKQAQVATPKQVAEVRAFDQAAIDDPRPPPTFATPDDATCWYTRLELRQHRTAVTAEALASVLAQHVGDNLGRYVTAESAKQRAQAGADTARAMASEDEG